MKVRITVPHGMMITIELSRPFVDDLLPLLRRASTANVEWPIQQQLTFKTLADYLEQAMDALKLVEERRPN